MTPETVEETTEGGLPIRDLFAFAGVTNLAYIVIFLRNGGERLRAIWLTMRTLKIEMREAKEWVDSVKLVQGPLPELLPEWPPVEREAPAMVASHWPPTVEAILKANIRSGFGTSGSPIGNFRNEESVVRVDELLEVVAKTLGCRVDTLKAPIRLQDADGVELGEFVVKRLVIALLSEVVAKGVECHGGNVVSSDISLENVKVDASPPQ